MAVSRRSTRSSAKTSLHCTANPPPHDSIALTTGAPARGYVLGFKFPRPAARSDPKAHRARVMHRREPSRHGRKTKPRAGWTRGQSDGSCVGPAMNAIKLGDEVRIMVPGSEGDATLGTPDRWTERGRARIASRRARLRPHIRKRCRGNRMADIILHHYETSPYAEKIRVAFGIKGLAWSSVEIPRIMPKPDLMPLTGGYRKTPVMQIGADIYCDTQLILRELDARHPEPPLNPHAGMGDSLAWWAEKAMFTPSVIVGFANIVDQLPDSFKQDRAKFSGRNFDPAAMKASLPYQLDQLRAHMGLLDRALADGRNFLLGEQPETPDLAAYHCVWFVQRNAGKTAAPLGEFRRLLAWAERIAAIGHGRRSELSSQRALEIAKEATPAPAPA